MRRGDGPASRNGRSSVFMIELQLYSTRLTDSGCGVEPLSAEALCKRASEWHISKSGTWATPDTLLSAVLDAVVEQVGARRQVRDSERDKLREKVRSFVLRACGPEGLRPGGTAAGITLRAQQFGNSWDTSFVFTVVFPKGVVAAIDKIIGNFDCPKCGEFVVSWHTERQCREMIVARVMER